MPHMSGASPTRHFQERPRLAGEPEPRELRLLAKQPLGDILPGEDRAAGGAQQIPEAMRTPHAGGRRRRMTHSGCGGSDLTPATQHAEHRAFKFRAGWWRSEERRVGKGWSKRWTEED